MPLAHIEPLGVRYIRSRDCQSQIAAPMTDDLHKLVWGWMGWSNRPYDLPLVETDDPKAWVLESRKQAPPMPTRIPYEYRAEAA